MFDEVEIRCPDCGHINVEQSKAARCNFDRFTVESAPLQILGDLVDSSPLRCEQCSGTFKIVVQRLVSVLPVP